MTADFDHRPVRERLRPRRHWPSPYKKMSPGPHMGAKFLLCANALSGWCLELQARGKGKGIDHHPLTSDVDGYRLDFSARSASSNAGRSDFSERGRFRMVISHCWMAFAALPTAA